MRTPEQVDAIVAALEAEYPDALCSLEYDKDYELLFSVRLAAQCTDERVNMVTPALFERFPTLEAFAAADVKIFTNIFAARETDTLGVSSKMLAEAAGGEYAPSYEDAAARVKEIARGGDLVLILGAGTVVRVADMLGG